MFCVTFCPSKMFGDQRTSRTKCPPRALALAQRSLDPPTGACLRRTRNDAGQIHPQACIRQRSLGFNNLAGAEVWLKRPGPESYFHDDSIGRSDPEVVSARKRRARQGESSSDHGSRRNGELRPGPLRRVAGKRQSPRLRRKARRRARSYRGSRGHNLKAAKGRESGRISGNARSLRSLPYPRNPKAPKTGEKGSLIPKNGA